MLRVAIVFFAGGLGSATRYLVGGRIQALAGAGFPAGTLAVNVTGSFLIALVMGLGLRTSWISDELRLLLTTGFCGGYTTYSTFNYETLALAQQGALAMAGGYVAATVVGCLAGGYLGLLLSRVIAG